MTAKTPNDPRVLLVVSKDYGELGLTISLLRDQALARQARVLLPARMFSINQDALPFATSPWATVEDIISAFEAHQPDLVILLSGYLLANEDRLMSPEALDSLLRLLRDRGCPFVTSDPYLGLASWLTISDVDLRTHPGAEPKLFRWLLLPIQRLLNPRRKVARVPSLEDVIHLYYTSIPQCNDHIQRRSFFNPAIIRSVTGTGAVAVGSGTGDVRDPRPSWLFVLNTIDLYVQRTLLGARAFTEAVLGMLRHTAKADRRATLVVPPALVEVLVNALPDSADVLPPCPYPEFEQRLHDAEYVFYWNTFSHSQIARIANEQPVFVFDRGHASRILKPYFEVARSCHYGGWEPPLLDQRSLPGPDKLAQLAKAQIPPMRALRERWRESPTPDELVNQLILGAARGQD